MLHIKKQDKKKEKHELCNRFCKLRFERYLRCKESKTKPHAYIYYGAVSPRNHPCGGRNLVLGLIQEAMPVFCLVSKIQRNVDCVFDTQLDSRVQRNFVRHPSTGPLGRFIESSKSFGRRRGRRKRYLAVKNHIKNNNNL